MVSTDPTVVTLGVNSVALKVTICCTAVLYMKMLCTLLIQGGKRIIAGPTVTAPNCVGNLLRPPI